MVYNQEECIIEDGVSNETRSYKDSCPGLDL